MEKRVWYTASSNGIGRIYNASIRDEHVDAKGIFIIVHGMSEHSDRYLALSKKLAAKGYIVGLQDLQGHGRSQNLPGNFGPEPGFQYMLHDLHRLVLRLMKWYPSLPVIMLGHSMGSFLARSYVLRFPGDLSGLIISGTAGFQYSYYAVLASLTADIKMHGDNLCMDKYDEAFMKYMNRAIKEPHHPAAWCTTDDALLMARNEDPLSCRLTIGAYRDMLSALINIRPEKWAALVPMIPIYIFSGGADPVGNFGAGPAEVYAWLYETGHDVTLRLYPGKRHEMLNETNRNEVEENLFRWLDDKAFRTL